jgi:hypothetical protein
MRPVCIPQILLGLVARTHPHVRRACPRSHVSRMGRKQLTAGWGHLLPANVKNSMEEPRAEIARNVLDVGKSIELARTALPDAPH